MKIFLIYKLYILHVNFTYKVVYKLETETSKNSSIRKSAKEFILFFQTVFILQNIFATMVNIPQNAASSIINVIQVPYFLAIVKVVFLLYTLLTSKLKITF